ncbi:MAG TPA: hypothetical protein VJI68_01300 [Candidatus Nanoarchaeia archaeon]|nr:hypothetical protein [Candidatus Nanoarchaeia archaeon]
MSFKKKVHHEKHHQHVEDKKIVEKDLEPVHIQINNPVSLRRSILESAILVTRLIKSYDDLRMVKERKINLMSSFAKNYEELGKSLSKLHHILPALNLPESKVEIKKHEMPKLEEPKTEYTNDDIIRLKMELHEVENKLRNF